MRPIQDKTKANMLMIIEVLQKYKQLHLRAICKAISNEYGKTLNIYTVNRIVTVYLQDYLQINDYTETIGLRLKICSLLPEYENMNRQEIVQKIIKKSIRKRNIISQI